jgi:hypothetical protein
MQDELLWKARLLVDGIRLDPSALEGVGTTWKEQLHHLFEYDFDVHQSHRSPAEFRLPGGAVVQVRLNERSRYFVTRAGGELRVEEHGLPLFPIEWLARPAYYSQTTSVGLPMTSIAEMVGEDCISVCHTNACITFSDKKQCAFCNMNFNPRQYDEVLIRKRAAEVGEVMQAAFSSGVARHFLITGGILPGNQEMEVLVNYLTAIREATGFASLPGAAIMTPPPDLTQLERLHALGLQSVGFNLECYDPAFFAAVCPGKQARIGYEKYRDALRAAVGIFGAGGRIFSGFVAGIEPMEYLLDGVQALAEEGVASIPLVWSPSAGTRFKGHRPPEAEWFVELSQRVSAIMIRHMKRPASGATPEPVRCHRCLNQCLLHDVLQSRFRFFQTIEPSNTKGRGE